MRAYLHTFILSILSMGALQSQTCCSGGVPVSSNLGYQSADKGTLQLSISADFNVLKTLKTGSERLDDSDRLRTTQSLILRGAYSVSERLTVEGFLPLVRQTRRITTNTGAFDREQTIGIGDPVALLIYDLIKKDITIRLGSGPQIPLGSTDQKNKIGITLLEDLQPGSGAWDIISLASLEYTRPQRPSSLLYMNLIYSATGKNNNSRSGAQTYEFGNDLQIISGYSDQVLIGGTILNPGLSFRYRTAERDRVNVSDLPGTGGAFLFTRLSIGLPFPKLSGSFFFNFEAPLWSRVNETQLAPSYVINTGWTMTFVKEQPTLQFIEID